MGAFACMIIGAMVFHYISLFFSQNEIKFQSPVEFHKPVWIQQKAEPTAMVDVVETAQAAEPEVVAFPIEVEKIVEIPADPVDEIVRKIYQLESSSGKNDKCVREGEGYNGYGWGQSATKMNCYSDREQVRVKVANWVSSKLKTMSLPQLLCSYNLGPNSEHLKECMDQSDAYPYYRDYLRIK